MCKFGFYPKFIYYKPKNDNEESLLCFPSLTLSFCWVYKKKGKKIFSGSFAPIGVGERWFTNKSDKSLNNLFFLFLSLSFLHYENGKGFFLSWGQFEVPFEKFNMENIKYNYFFSLFHLELGFSL